MRGLLTLLGHGPPTPNVALVTVGGGMGSLLGPADGLYHDLGVPFAAQGIATVRVGYRKPDDSRAACTTWPRPPISPAGVACAGS